jgi:ABC-type sugar transport system substrate-binding protein
MTIPIRLGLQIGSIDPFWVLVREAIYERANQLALDLVPIDIERPALLSLEQQTALFEEILAQELNGMICWDWPTELANRVLNHAIPIVHLIESDLKHPLFTSPRGLYDIAYMLAGYLAKAIGGSGTILLVGGLRELSGEDGRSRIQGFQDAIQGFDAIQVQHIPTLWNYQQAYDEVYHYFAERPSACTFGAVYGLSDSLALAGRDALLAHALLADPPLVFGINGDPLALSAIHEGSMTATVETSASDFGFQAVDRAYQAAVGKPLSSYFSYKPILVTAENVSTIAVQKLTSMAKLPNRLIGHTRQQQQQRLIQLETSLQISRAIGAFLNVRQLCQETAESICSKYDYDHVQIAMWNEAEAQFDVIQSGFSYTARTTVPVHASGLLEIALARKTLIFIPDVQNSQQFEGDIQRGDTGRVLSFLSNLPKNYGGSLT